MNWKTSWEIVLWKLEIKQWAQLFFKQLIKFSMDQKILLMLSQSLKGKIRAFNQA